MLLAIKSGPSSHTKTRFLSPCNPLWCINLVVHSMHLSTSVQPCVRRSSPVSYLPPVSILWLYASFNQALYASFNQHPPVQPSVRSTPELLSMRVGASELEPFLLLLLILTLEPKHSLAVGLLQLTILIFSLGGIII